MIGRPYKTESIYSDWACPVALLGLHGVFPDMHGVDSWQALQIAQNLVERFLQNFLDDGGKLYWDREKSEMTLRELFSTKEEVPEPDPQLSSLQEEYINQLSDDELSLIDLAIIDNSSTQWRKIARVVGGAMSASSTEQKNLPDIFYAQRVRKLVLEGKLESRGDMNYMRFSEVRLPQDTGIA